MANQFKAGDQVQLISGSMTMTVERIWEDGACQVAYWNPEKKEIILFKLNSGALKKI